MIAKEQSSLANDDPNLEVKYGLPREVQFCRRCVISNQRPASTVETKNRGASKQVIAFDEEGVCSACRYQDMKDREIDWEERERELMALCDRFRSRNGNYDCIVPGSGGKDSAFTSHVLKFKYNMNPLTVTWAPHKYTGIGFKNFENWIHTGFDNILLTPNGRLHRLLTQKAFINLCHPFQPFIVGQRQIAPRIASQYNVPLIFYGENQAEYGNDLKENFNPKMKEEFFTGDPADEIYIGGEPLTKTIKDNGFYESDRLPYMPISLETAHQKGIEVHYLGYYIKWDPQEMYYYAVENTGFQSNEYRTEGSFSKYSSIDDQIDPLHYYTTLAKFGIGRATYDAAQEVRTGKLERDEAVMLVNKFDTEFPERFFAAMLEYMNITKDQFWNVIDEARSPHLWRHDGNQWVLRNPLT
jgi:N-acetyl sugar amidotransferase